MDYKSLQEHIHSLAKDINYPAKKVDHLVFALKLSTTPGHLFFHSGFEAVGKSILEAVNTHYLFTRGYLTEKGINEAKKAYREKGEYAKFAKEHNLWKYVYNYEAFAEEDEKILPKDSDEALLARVVGAMYYDSDWETTKNWIICNLGIRSFKKTGSIESSK